MLRILALVCASLVCGGIAVAQESDHRFTARVLNRDHVYLVVGHVVQHGATVPTEAVGYEFRTMEFDTSPLTPCGKVTIGVRMVPVPSSPGTVQVYNYDGFRFQSRCSLPFMLRGHRIEVGGGEITFAMNPDGEALGGNAPYIRDGKKLIAPTNEALSDMLTKTFKDIVERAKLASQ